MCVIQPLAVAGQVPCSDLEMRLGVLVESSGQTEAEAEDNLAAKIPGVVQAIGMPCITEGYMTTEQYTDGTWHAVRVLGVDGSEEDLRRVAESLGDAATPLRLYGNALPGALYAAGASLPAFFIGTMTVRRLLSKGGDALTTYSAVCVLGFLVILSASLAWTTRISWVL